MIVALDAGEIATARVIATLRRSVNEMTGIKEPLPVRSSFDDEFTGAVAELAFAKRFNVFPDLSCRPRAGTPDCRVGEDRIDVKAVTKRHHNLIASIRKHDSADRYVLGVVEGYEVDFIGWVYAHEFICDETVTDLGHGPTYVLPQSKLRKFPEDSNNQEAVPA